MNTLADVWMPHTESVKPTMVFVNDKLAIAGRRVGLTVDVSEPLPFETGDDEPISNDTLAWMLAECPRVFGPDSLIYGPDGATFILCESGTEYRLEWRTPTGRTARKGWQGKTQGRVVPLWLARTAAAGARSYDVTGTIRAFDALTWLCERARERCGYFAGRFPGWWRKLAMRLAADWTGAEIEIEPGPMGRGLVKCTITAASAA